MVLQEARLLFILTTFTIFGITRQAVAPESCIFYGKEASIYEFPYFAALSDCGAVILSDSWLVTAAHCVEEPNQNPDNRVWVGGENNSNSQEISYKKAIIHPRYETIYGISINDIALLELDQKLKFTNNIKPIQIGGHSIGKKLMFVGKAIDEAAHHLKSIKKLELTRLTTEQCLSEFSENIQRLLRPNIKKLEWVNICTKRPEDKSRICMGDSGSPLTDGNKLVGIASYIVNLNSNHTRLNIFTNVPTYTSWIKFVTGLNEVLLH